MRRKDREITDFDEICSVIGRSKVIRIAFFDEKYPYILPVQLRLRKKGRQIVFLYSYGFAG